MKASFRGSASVSSARRNGSRFRSEACFRSICCPPASLPGRPDRDRGYGDRQRDYCGPGRSAGIVRAAGLRRSRGWTAGRPCRLGHRSDPPDRDLGGRLSVWNADESVAADAQLRELSPRARQPRSAVDTGSVCSSRVDPTGPVFAHVTARHSRSAGRAPAPDLTLLHEN